MLEFESVVLFFFHFFLHNFHPFLVSLVLVLTFFFIFLFFTCIGIIPGQHSCLDHMVYTLKPRFFIPSVSEGDIWGDMTGP